MPQVSKKTNTMKVDFKCPKCEKGHLRPNGTSVMTYPPQHPHNCNNFECDYSEIFIDTIYPYIDYVDSDD